jgi:tRNA-dihydrouridine synthase
LLASLDFDGVDLNMGCPAAKVAKQGSGAGLIRTPQLAQTLIRTCQKAAQDWANGITLEEGGVHPDLIEVARTMRHKPLETLERRLLPISVKTRIGYDTIVAQEWISTLLEVAPATITLHGRTLKQMYTGKANWEVIGEMAALVKASGTGIGLWGNGDIESMEEAEAKIGDYGVEGVLVGRGALGNPWFFQGKTPTVQEVLGSAIEHSAYREKELSELPFAPIRKHLLWYCKDFPNAKELRMKLCGANNASEVREVIEAFLASLGEQT